MSVFVHLAEAGKIDKIKRSGIKPAAIHNVDYPLGVFCMPVTNDFFSTHQWARELMRFGKKNLHGVYFRIPDTETVWFGRYNECHRRAEAAKASLAFNNMDGRMGFQVVIPRKIYAREIFKIKAVPPLGWRFFPASKGRKPCLCPACIRAGEYGSKKMAEQRLEDYKKQMQCAKNVNERVYALNEMAELISNRHLRLEDWENLFAPELTRDGRTLMAIGNVIFSLKNETALNRFIALLPGAPVDVQAWTAAQIMVYKGDKGREILGDLLRIPEVMREIIEYEEWIEDDC